MEKITRLAYATGGLRLSHKFFANIQHSSRLRHAKAIFYGRGIVEAGHLSSQKLDSIYIIWGIQHRQFHDSAEDQFTDDEYEPSSYKGSSVYVNVDRWKWKLNVLRNSQDVEIVSTDRRDRRDYECLASLAERMGFYSQMYGKAVVLSKIPLPNYRPDLDDKRPVRKVSIPVSIHKVVDGLLQEHLDRKEIFQGQSEAINGTAVNGYVSNRQTRRQFYPNVEDSGSSGEFIDEDILHKKDIHLHAKQHHWQGSPEGQRMLALRMKLPVFRERELLLSNISMNQVVVVSGDTGCGKTTQLPQYILESEIEAGRGTSCTIICTQPRRISAISVSERVAAERGEELGESVGYKVRFEGMRGRNTRLLFCTSGILLRRLLVDPSLRGVSHVIVDEIHERGMNEDFLLIVLKDLLPRRTDLRLILMSATLNAELFSSYFGGAPMCHIPGFTHPVRGYFLEDVLEMTGHRLTEENQVDSYGMDRSWKMQKQLQSTRRKNPIKDLAEEALAGVEYRAYSSSTQFSLSQWSPEGLSFNLIEAVLCFICAKKREGAILIFMTGWEDINALKDQLKRHPLLGDPLKVRILPCHGAMATADQKLIFDPVPPNMRKIVLATNMAETSITIDDVVFVVDCGKAKETSYDALNNTPCLLPTWISKASALQRRGRAGRVQPGECYHLYPKAVFDSFVEYQIPELLRTPLHSLCLQSKSLRLGSIEEFLSKALQPPETLSVQNAIELLKTIGALDDNEELTFLGHHLSMLPVEPRIGKMLIMGSIFRCLDPVLTIAAGLTIRDPFVLPSDKKMLAEKARLNFGEKDCSDHIALVRAYDGWLNALKAGSASDYCWNNFLSFHSLQAMQSLRNQFKTLLAEAGFLGQEAADYNQFSHDRELLGGVICAGLFPGIAAVLHSVLSKMEKIAYPWLTYNEKLRTGIVTIRDSTGVSDSMVLLFGGKVTRGERPGQVFMHDGRLEFYMSPDLSKTILSIKEELNELLGKKLEDPKMDIYKEGGHLIDAIFELLRGDQNQGAFGVRLLKSQNMSSVDPTNVKSVLQGMVQRAGCAMPKYKVRFIDKGLFQAKVEFMKQQIIGAPARTKKQAEKNAAANGIEWLNKASSTSGKGDYANKGGDKSGWKSVEMKTKAIEHVNEMSGGSTGMDKASVLRDRIRTIIKGGQL